MKKDSLRQEKEKYDKLKASLSKGVREAIKLRSDVAEFHGLERELVLSHDKMLARYEETKDIKHPRDLGDARENILRSFLIDSGLIPGRYEISRLKVRVTEPGGTSSNE